MRMSVDDERAASRASWPVTVSELHHSTDVPMGGTAAERLAALWELSITAHRLAGMSVDPTPRSSWPVRIARRAPR